MKAYISGPITGVEGYMRAFDRAERRIKAEGDEVVNPAVIMWAMPESTTHEQYMKISIDLLDQCDYIYMLEGWQQSKGATMEFEHAVRKGMTVAFEKGMV